MIEKIETNMAPLAIGPYSQAVFDENYIFLSGQIPIDPETGAVVEENILIQTEQVIKNIKEILKATGSDISKVVKTTCFIKDMVHFDGFNSIYENHFISKPARSCVSVKKLPKDSLCEIEVIAKR
ncbi:Rid family detoxifying hydrolase [Alkalispirochaeta sphaeroplastigenens]|uniref:Rid family detoxifying hydrolase n=1 Tax=Alkalispirochaeta sphaeroplastigenens TaxID=1187066 RepID=UPI000CDA19D2|nr:Rid family detoxifying hydrolase [Alkalispirochaeta sphaeroplastigenens]